MVVVEARTDAEAETEVEIEVIPFVHGEMTQETLKVE